MCSGSVTSHRPDQPLGSTTVSPGRKACRAPSRSVTRPSPASTKKHSVVPRGAGDAQPPTVQLHEPTETEPTLTRGRDASCGSPLSTFFLRPFDASFAGAKYDFGAWDSVTAASVCAAAPGTPPRAAECAERSAVVSAGSATVFATLAGCSSPSSERLAFLLAVSSFAILAGRWRAACEVKRRRAGQLVAGPTHQVSGYSLGLLRYTCTRLLPYGKQLYEYDPPLSGIR